LINYLMACPAAAERARVEIEIIYHRKPPFPGTRLSKRSRPRIEAHGKPAIRSQGPGAKKAMKPAAKSVRPRVRQVT
jgi:hypothetical protein